MSSPPSLINDCFLHDKDRLRHDQALKLLEERLHRTVGWKNVSLNKCLGRIVAQDIHAPHPVPLHTNSAVDGYAFKQLGLAESTVEISQVIAAGQLSPASLKRGTAARIFTGAPMPAEADTVAMQEDCTRINGAVRLPAGLKFGANCRLAGEDLQSGDLIFKAGSRLHPAGLAALASVGMAKVPVFKKLKIALFSNGDEMRRPSLTASKLQPGEVFDANSPLLLNLLSSLPVTIWDGGIIKDNKKDSLTAISRASQSFDVIITTGGASRGDEDHMTSTLDELGKRHLWQLAVKPGRPMMFGQIPRDEKNTDCLFFGLPGNPVAAMICALLYVRPSLLKLAGANWKEPVRYKIASGFAINSKKPDRREFLRGILKQDAEGSNVLMKFERDGSGLISSLRDADGLIEIDEETSSVEPGDLVNFIPFSSFN